MYGMCIYVCMRVFVRACVRVWARPRVHAYVRARMHAHTPGTIAICRIKITCYTHRLPFCHNAYFDKHMNYLRMPLWKMLNLYTPLMPIKVDHCVPTNSHALCIFCEPYSFSNCTFPRETSRCTTHYTDCFNYVHFYSYDRLPNIKT